MGGDHMLFSFLPPFSAFSIRFKIDEKSHFVSDIHFLQYYRIVNIFISLFTKNHRNSDS